MKKIVLCLLLFNPFVVVAQGFLHASGKYVVDAQGRQVMLRGMGLGGWMLQEGYMLRLSNIGQQYKIRAGIEKLVGPEKAAEFYDSWLANDMRKVDVDSMKAWGFNSIRLPMHYALYTLPVDKEPALGRNTWLDKGFVLTDSLLKWCKADKMYLILDMHATPGGQGNDLPISDRDPDKPSLWQSTANQQKMIALWRNIAQRYANETYIGGYDLINEPNWGFDDPVKDARGTAEQHNVPLRKLMVDITAAIREVDKNHIIIIEGNGFGNNYNGVLPKWDDNLVMSFHKYGNFNNTNSIQRFLDLREQYDIPLWMGESGENSNTWYTEAIQLVENYDIGWSWWPLKKLGGNNPLQIKTPDNYQLFLDAMGGKGDLSSAQAIVILNQLVDNIKLENNIYYRDVIDAMFRQVQSAKAIPFKANIITDNTTINAVDYDLGRQHIAYYDRDSASYQYTPGVKTIGNKGYAYRNDGVDIEADADGFHVFSIADGEWLSYSLNVKTAGVYTVGFRVGSGVGGGKISLVRDGVVLAAAVAVPNTGRDLKWQMVEVKGVSLVGGVNRLIVKADVGGFCLKGLGFVKQ